MNNNNKSWFDFIYAPKFWLQQCWRQKGKCSIEHFVTAKILYSSTKNLDAATFTCRKICTFIWGKRVAYLSTDQLPKVIEQDFQLEISVIQLLFKVFWSTYQTNRPFNWWLIGVRTTLKLLHMILEGIWMAVSPINQPINPKLVVNK